MWPEGCDKASMCRSGNRSHTGKSRAEAEGKKSSACCFLDNRRSGWLDLGEYREKQNGMWSLESG